MSYRVMEIPWAFNERYIPSIFANFKILVGPKIKENLMPNIRKKKYIGSRNKILSIKIWLNYVNSHTQISDPDIMYLNALIKNG